MASASMDTASVRSAASEFREVGNHLSALFRKIDKEVEDITSAGLKGNTAIAAAQKYEEIKNEARCFSNKLAYIGDRIEETAASNENIDEDGRNAYNK